MKKTFCLVLAFSIVLGLCSCHSFKSSVPEDSLLNGKITDSLKSAFQDLSDMKKTYGTLFGQAKIIDINVTIQEDAWKDLCDNAKDEEYHAADITVNGQVVKNVGFRAKGFSSLTAVANSDSNRYGFKIKTDEYVKHQTLNGLDMFVLNGSYADPSYMREFLTYAAMAKLGGMTPYVAYANLHINGELFGFYLMIEAYDDSFVERYTNDSGAVLYKAEKETCTLLTSDNASGFDISYGKDEGNSHVKELIRVLNATTADNKDELEKMLDVDSVLKAAAVNMVMGNYDSYSGSKAHNYYLLWADKRFSYIGWDYNMSIAAFQDDNGGSVSVELASPVYGTTLEQRPLLGKLLAIDAYYQRYVGYVNELTAYFSDAQTTVSQLAAILHDSVANDPSAFYTIEQFEANTTDSGTTLTGKTGVMGNGAAPGAGGGFPQTGNTVPSMPNGATPPDGNTMPSMPNGMTPPDGNTMPSMPNGATPPDGGNPGGEKGGMLAANAVSVVDYLTQRVAFLRTATTATKP